MGHVNIEGCPQQYCSEIASVPTLSDLFQKGIPPIAGGSLDQSVWFLEASRFLQSAEAAIGADK